MKKDYDNNWMKEEQIIVMFLSSLVTLHVSSLLIKFFRSHRKGYKKMKLTEKTPGDL
jgi:hypothetical protein